MYTKTDCFITPESVRLIAMTITTRSILYSERHKFNVHRMSMLYRARIYSPLKEPRNRFPAWRAGATTLFVVPARQAT